MTTESRRKFEKASRSFAGGCSLTLSLPSPGQRFAHSMASVQYAVHCTITDLFIISGNSRQHPSFPLSIFSFGRSPPLFLHLLAPYGSHCRPPRLTFANSLYWVFLSLLSFFRSNLLPNFPGNTSNLFPRTFYYFHIRFFSWLQSQNPLPPL